MLKNVRIGISYVVMILWVLVFLGGERSFSMLSKPLLFFQFTPSLVNFFLAVGGGISLGFLCIIVLTLVCGRVYCACLCPTGILQDGVRSLTERFLKGKQRITSKYQKPFSILRCIILGGTMFFSIAGSLVVLNLLDPYSLFGRMITHLLRPVVLFFNNVIVSILESFDIYTLSHLPHPTIPRVTFGITCMFFFGILGIAAFRGRLYCNTICPVGTLLGIVSRFSLVKMTIRQEKCTSCKRCERACRSECINVAEYTIDESRCVRCFDCLSLCPETAIKYCTTRHPQKTESVDPGRRSLLIGSVSVASALMLLGIPLRVFSKQMTRQGRSNPNHTARLAQS